jgi:hypothetical protein
MASSEESRVAAREVGRNVACSCRPAHVGPCQEGDNAFTPLRAKSMSPGLGWSALGAVISVLVLLALPNAAEAGKCVDPPRGSTAFCQISYQVYVSADTMANDTAYWSRSCALCAHDTAGAHRSNSCQS